MAAASTLVVCMAVGMVGWFLTDAGAHGQPRDGLRTGALGWLAAHGSGFHVQGVLVSAVPLGITLVCAWTTWRIAHRVGGAISGHGPDADRIADGERDWTVPTAAALFAAGYVVVTVLTGSMAATTATRPSTERAVLWSLGLVVFLALPALAAGSGRLAIWASRMPAGVPPALAAAWAIVRTYAAVCLLTVLAALVVDLDTALNVLGQLGLDAKGVEPLRARRPCSCCPTRVLFGGAYLLGPGFAVGAGTLVTPSAVVLGPLPLYPLLAALPSPGPTPVWTPFLVAVPPLVAAVAVARAQRTRPVLRWDEGALRGCGAGLLAGPADRPGDGAGGRRGGTGSDAGRRAVRPGRAPARAGDLRLRRARRRPGDDPVAAAGNAGSARERDAAPTRVRAVHRPARLVVLVSGAGTNLQALLDATADPAYGATVVAVGADRAGTLGQQRAETAGVPTFVLRVPDFAARAEWDRALTEQVASYEPDLVVLAGFMKLVGPAFLGRVRRTHGQHPPGPVAVLPGDARAGRGAGLRREGHRLHALRRRRRGRHRSDRRPARGAGRGRRHRRPRCTSGSSSRSGRCSSTPSAGWLARASRSPTGRCGSDDRPGPDAGADPARPRLRVRQERSRRPGARARCRRRRDRVDRRLGGADRVTRRCR